MLTDRDVGKRYELPTSSIYLYIDIDSPKPRLQRCPCYGTRREYSVLFSPTQKFWCKGSSRNGQRGNLTKWFQRHSEMPVPFILARLRERCHELPAARSFPWLIVSNQLVQELPIHISCKTGSVRVLNLEVRLEKLMLLQWWATKSKSVDPKNFASPKRFEIPI